MADNRQNPERWRELAEQTSKEQDPAKLRELTDELLETLRDNDKRKSPSASR